MSYRNSGQETLAFLAIAGILVAYLYYKVTKHIKTKVRDEGARLAENLYRSKESQLYSNLEAKKKSIEAEIAQQTSKVEAKLKFLEKASIEFSNSFLKGRQWLAHFIAEAERAPDESRVKHLAFKKQPALKASQEVSAARSERRAYLERSKFLEYQLRSYKEYFPFLEDYEEAILEEAIPLTSGQASEDGFSNVDPVLRFVPKHEYESLTSSERNQLALDRYLNRSFSKAEIGKVYERYIGYLYEKDGWTVQYHGILEGLEDLGRDLICRKENQITIVQAKCWSSEKTIHEKHIFQLFGTTQLYEIHAAENLIKPNIRGVFVTTTKLSEVAKKAADHLGITVKEAFSLDKCYPIVKCNVNQSTKEKIYHLPFDQQYDRTVIEPAKGEFYAMSVAEAESQGFRRAFRFTQAG